MAKKEVVQGGAPKTLEGYFLAEYDDIYFFDSEQKLLSYLEKDYQDATDWMTKDSFNQSDNHAYLGSDIAVIKGSLVTVSRPFKLS